MDLVMDILNDGTKRARSIAIEKIKKAKELVGLIEIFIKHKTKKGFLGTFLLFLKLLPQVFY